jgi:hypothetical protein
MGDGTTETSAPIVGETDAGRILADAPTQAPQPPIEIVATAPAPEPAPAAAPTEAAEDDTVQAERGASTVESLAPMSAETSDAPVPREAPPAREPLVAQAMLSSAPARAPAPPADLDGLLSSAGLQLVNTDASKLAEARAQGAESVVTPRPARERKRTAPPAAEPLAQVETRKH